MATKRKVTLKQVFNAWLKYNKKSNEARDAKYRVTELADQCEKYSTELIEHEGAVFRVTVNGTWDRYQVEKIAKTSELPTRNGED